MTSVGLAALALLAGALLPPHPGPSRRGEDGEKALELAALAHQRYSQGRYADAVRAWEKLARLYPETDAGRVARRRVSESGFLGWRDVLRHGPSSNRVDIVLMGDGYVLEHQDMFDDLAEAIPGRFQRQPVFGEYYSYLNFRAAQMISAENGVDGFGREYDTALGADTGKTDLGHVVVNRQLVHEALAELPEHDDLAIVFVKNGVAGTGGNGIAAIGGMGTRITLHEWGHAFGDLADEYATHTHDRGRPTNRANCSITDKPQLAPWSHWIDARVPGIGMYEGGSGQARDVWRPTASECLMNSAENFCRVCREALVLRIYSLVDPIDSCYPPAPDTQAGPVLRGEPLDFEVRVMMPTEHALEVRWWLVPEDRLVDARMPPPAPENTRYLRRSYGDRRDRGPLPAVPGVAVSVSNGDRRGVHRFRIEPGDLEPRRYRLICRVNDTTRWRGEKWPWVLRDPHGLLESERAWWILVR